MNGLWDEWVLDVTFSPRMPPCFCPYESATGRVVVGMSLITDRCPGKLIGVYHSDGAKAAEAWCKDNPNWRTEYVADRAWQTGVIK